MRVPALRDSKISILTRTVPAGFYRNDGTIWRRHRVRNPARSGDVETYFFGENSAIRLAAGKTSAEFWDATCTAKRFVVNIIAPSSGVLTGGG